MKRQKCLEYFYEHDAKRTEQFGAEMTDAHGVRCFERFRDFAMELRLSLAKNKYSEPRERSELNL
jgi:hypothetical protein